MERILPIIIIFLFIISIYFALFMICYHKCPKDKIIVVYGYLGKDKFGARCVQGRGVFVWPIIQSYKFLDLTPILIKISLEDSLSKNSIPIDINASFTVGISTEDGIMQYAAERLLGLSQNDIKDIAKDILVGILHVVIEKRGPEEIKSNKNQFFSDVYNNAEEDLKKIGLKLIEGNIDV